MCIIILEYGRNTNRHIRYKEGGDEVSWAESQGVKYICSFHL